MSLSLLSARFGCHTYQERDRQAFVGASSRWNVYNGFVMAGGKTKKRGSREESVFLELLRTTDILSAGAPALRTGPRPGSSPPNAAAGLRLSLLPCSASVPFSCAL